MAEDDLSHSKPAKQPEIAHVLALSPEREADARHWAGKLELSLVRPEAAETNRLHLVPTREGLELWAGSQRRSGIARVDFNKRVDRRPGRGRPPLQRAIGRAPLTVVDATAGFGDDTIALAGFGHRVLALERSRLIASMLEDSRLRTVAHPSTLAGEIAARIRVECTDACGRLIRLDEVPDVVYLDPMYPDSAHSGSALPRIEIQLLRRLLGSPADPRPLFGAALASGTRRIVIKRPLRAAPLVDGRTAHHAGKLARYDVYDAIGLRSSCPPSRPGECA